MDSPSRVNPENQLQGPKSASVFASSGSAVSVEQLAPEPAAIAVERLGEIPVVATSVAKAVNRLAERQVSGIPICARQFDRFPAIPGY
jgi:hypothetical protein